MLRGLGGPVQHDLNNMVMVIEANLDLLGRGALSEAQVRQLGRIGEAVARLDALTRALTGVLSTPEAAPVRASQVVQGLAPLLAVLVPKPGALMLELAADDPPQTLDQAALMQRVLGAALAAGKAGRLTVTVDAAGAVTFSPES